MMIQVMRINWADRLKKRKELNANGFISQNIVAQKHPKLILKNFRKKLISPNKVEAIKLDISGATTYWYDKKLDFN